MNIFFLDKTPELSAQYLCDKHIPKMLLESCQMLSTAIQNYTDRIEKLYKPAYPNHPMTKWVGYSYQNFDWAYSNAVFINLEYKKRFKKNHKSYRILKYIYDVGNHMVIPNKTFTKPPQCMPDEYKDNDYVTAYRNYYKGEKTFAKWEKGRSQPEWWN